MDYKFKYKSPFERKSFNKKANKVLSDFIFFLYGNSAFKKLKLDKNEFLKSHISLGKNRIVHTKSTMPVNPNLNLYSISFFDCTEIEDTQKFKDRLIRIASKYSGGLLSEKPARKINKVLDNFDTTYKTLS